MAGGAIGQLCQHHWIIFETGFMACQAPTHIHFLWLGNGHLAELAVAVFTVQPRGNVGAVAEIDKVRQDGHRDPLDGLVLLHVGSQFVNFGVAHADLLMTGPALAFRGQTR